MDLDDRTPLVLAAEAKHEDVCRILLDCGAGTGDGQEVLQFSSILNEVFHVVKRVQCLGNIAITEMALRLAARCCWHVG